MFNLCLNEFECFELLKHSIMIYHLEKKHNPNFSNSYSFFFLLKFKKSYIGYSLLMHCFYNQNKKNSSCCFLKNNSGQENPRRALGQDKWRWGGWHLASLLKQASSFSHPRDSSLGTSCNSELANQKGQHRQAAPFW